MKKFWLIVSLTVVLVLAFSSLVMAAETFKLGYDFSGNIKGSGSSNEERNTDPGLTLGYEFTVPQDQLEYGFGVQCQLERAVKDTGGKFYFIPVYGLLNYNFTKGGEAQPYVTARLGYNFLTANDAFKAGHDVRGGLYYGAGFGVNFSSQYQLELLYSENKGYLDGGNDIINHQVSLNVGFRF